MVVASVTHKVSILVVLHTALAVDGIILQAAEHTRAVHFRRQVLDFSRGMRSAAVDGCLLAATNDVQYIGNQVFFIEMRERRKNPGTIATGCKKGGIKFRLATTIFQSLLLQPALHLGMAFIAGLARWFMLDSSQLLPFRLDRPRFFVFKVKVSVVTQNECPSSEVKTWADYILLHTQSRVVVQSFCREFRENEEKRQKAVGSGVGERIACANGQLLL